MAWKEFDRTTATRTTEPCITIQRRGTISANGPAMELFHPGEDKPEKFKVKLLYDSERQLVGIKHAEPGDPNAHLLRKQGASDVYLVSGTLFCQHFNIDTTYARRYKAQVHEGILGIRLTDPHAVVGRRVRDNDGKDPSDRKSHKNGDQAVISDLNAGFDQPEDSADQDPWSG